MAPSRPGADLLWFRLLLAAWVLMKKSLNTVFLQRGPSPRSRYADVRTRTALGLLAVVLFLDRGGWGWISSSPLVVQTHPLVGSDAFWMTRPIPPVTLMLSKVVLLSALFLVVRTLSDIAIMAAYDLPAGWMHREGRRRDHPHERRCGCSRSSAGAVVTRTLAGVSLISGAAVAVAGALPRHRPA